ncbi:MULTISPECIES: hypothetical protein [unclassified Agrococcus]|uniref:hypothetical protein n=1 Tax=unclassified Agrococcus TaxID=2615065 RepID=UPI003623E9C0
MTAQREETREMSVPSLGILSTLVLAASAFTGIALSAPVAHASASTPSSQVMPAHTAASPTLARADSLAATPSGCVWSLSGQYSARATCSSGPGQYRLVGRCTNGTALYGPWRVAGGTPQTSTISCGLGIREAWIEVR